MAEDDPDTTEQGVLSGDDFFFALVGWDAVGLGDRMVLKLQAIQTGVSEAERKVHLFEYYLNRQQALQLGNYILEVSGNAPRHRKRSWLDRMLEGGSS